MLEALKQNRIYQKVIHAQKGLLFSKWLAASNERLKNKTEITTKLVDFQQKRAKLLFYKLLREYLRVKQSREEVKVGLYNHAMQKFRGENKSGRLCLSWKEMEGEKLPRMYYMRKYFEGFIRYRTYHTNSV